MRDAQRASQARKGRGRLLFHLAVIEIDDCLRPLQLARKLPVTRRQIQQRVSDLLVRCFTTIARARQLLNLVEPTATPAAEPDPTTQVLASPCPCYGGRMFVIETFEPGCQPHHRPTAPLMAIRIDTS